MKCYKYDKFDDLLFALSAVSETLKTLLNEVLKYPSVSPEYVRDFYEEFIRLKTKEAKYVLLIKEIVKDKNLDIERHCKYFNSVQLVNQYFWMASNLPENFIDIIYKSVMPSFKEDKFKAFSEYTLSMQKADSMEKMFIPNVLTETDAHFNEMVNCAYERYTKRAEWFKNYCNSNNVTQDLGVVGQHLND